MGAQPVYARLAEHRASSVGRISRRRRQIAVASGWQLSEEMPDDNAHKQQWKSTRGHEKAREQGADYLRLERRRRPVFRSI